MTKKLLTNLIGIILFSFIFSSFALAKDFSLPDVSLTPDSPFYFLKSWKESIQLFFTFGAENKAKQYLHLAGVRVAEYQKMVEKGKTDLAQKTLEKYEEQLNKAVEKTNELKKKGKDIESITEKSITNQAIESISKHVKILQENLQKVPEAAKKGIENAIENSQKQMEKLLEKTGICENLCGDGTCQEVVCMAQGCPCPENKETCPQDCKTDEEKEVSDKLEKACLNSGGKISTSLCCLSVSDFSSNCLIGGCGCSPDNSHQVKTCDCGQNKCFNGEKCVSAKKSGGEEYPLRSTLVSQPDDELAKILNISVKNPLDSNAAIELEQFLPVNASVESFSPENGGQKTGNSILWYVSLQPNEESFFKINLKFSDNNISIPSTHLIIRSHKLTNAPEYTLPAF